MKSSKRKNAVSARKTDKNVEKVQKRVTQRLRSTAGLLRKPLVEKETIWSQFLFWGGAVFLFLGLTILVFLLYAFFAFDWQGSKIGFFSTVLATDPENVSNAIGSFIELLAAILGIMITVVAIVLQLAAQRYGTRLTDLFLADKVNRIYFSLLVCSLIYAILVIFATKNAFFPYFAIEVLLVLTLLEIA